MRILFIAMITCSLAAELSRATPEKYASGIPSLDAFLKSKHSAPGAVVVGMTGFYGQDQPQQWLILTKDRTSDEMMEEWVIADGKIQGKREIRRLPMQDLPTLSIDRSRLKVDSDEAFVIAERLADRALMGYDSVHYQLRTRDLGNEPVWVVNMLDPAGRSVGIHYISAESGNILRSIWHRPVPASISKSQGSGAKPESLLYGANVRELTLSGNLGRRTRQVTRIIEPKAAE